MRIAENQFSGASIGVAVQNVGEDTGVDIGDNSFTDIANPLAEDQGLSVESSSIGVQDLSIPLPIGI